MRICLKQRGKSVERKKYKRPQKKESVMKAYLTIIICIILATAFTMRTMRSKNKNDNITIGFAGDTMLGRLVNETIESHGYDYPWGNTLPLIKNPDLRIINLETTLTTHKKAVPKAFNFRASPDRVRTLQEAHIDIVNLANNHILDFDIKGMRETLKTLDKVNIKHVGAGENSEQAQKAVIIKKNDITIGVIGYTDNEPGWEAEHGKPGVNYIKAGDTAKIAPLIKNLKKQVDIIIVTCHWGPNMRVRPSQEFINFTHDIIDAGADIIHGHSAHVFQGIEIYKNKLIMYDTGDFVDDYAIDPVLRNDQSFFFEVTVDKHGPQSVQLTPLIIQKMQVNKATGNEAKTIMKKMQMLCQEFGTTVSDAGIVRIR
jgi:poly-gamma-glutamate synthesis protein (capsule biosynthesis protein)